MKNKFRLAIEPFKDRYRVSPLWVKAVVILGLSWILIPIDIFDILFPWMAFSDDLFIAGVIINLLYKYGSSIDTPCDQCKEIHQIKPIDLVRQILGRS